MSHVALRQRSALRRAGTVVLAAVLGTAALPAVDAMAASTKLPPGMHEVKTHFVAVKRHDTPTPKHKAGVQDRVTASDGTTASLVPAPSDGPARSNWIVNYDAGFTTATSGPQAQAAFQAAVDIWSHIVYSPVTIVVDASYADLGGNVLGQAAAKAAYSCSCLGDGTHNYPVALANALYGSDIDSTKPDIVAQFNSNPVAPFYYGTDGAPTSGTVDFESVVLHELGHGLGFAGSMSMANGATNVTYLGTPMKWDTFLQDGVGTPMLSYASGSSQLTTAMESPLYWSGTNGTVATGGTAPHMYAPTTWEQGSSGGAHLDETAYPRGDANSLMTPAISAQEAVHSPGAIAVAIFRDIGWTASLPTGSAPSAPTGVAATRGDGSAGVSWTASTDYGNAVTQYVATASPGGATCSTTGALTCTVSGLTNGTSYTFTVRATNSIGTSSASTASSAVVPAGKPATPTAPTGSPSNGAVTVSWTTPSNNGDAITGYSVESSADNGTTWSSPSASALTSTATQAAFTGLSNGTSYVFRVAASNGIGQGSFSPQSAGVTPAATPGAPTSVTAGRGDMQATVSWTAPSDIGGSAITGYRLEWSSNGGTTWSSPLSSALTSTATGATVTGLTNGTSYVFHVAAINAIGTSPFSTASSAMTPAGAPATPINVSGTAGDGHVTLTWTAPAANGAAITGYDVESSTDSVAWSSPLASALTSTATSAIVSSLTNGQAYHFRVAAINAVGTGAASATASTVIPAAVPGTPTNVAGTRGNAQVTLSWTAPAANGAAITSYVVRSSTDGGTTWEILGTTTGSPVLITSLTNGTPYVFDVAAVNSAGQGAFSAASNAVTPATTPGAPTNVGGAAGDGQVSVTWTAPSSNGGTAITGYDVEWSSDSGSTWSAPQSTASTATLVTGLTNGTPYVFKVAARNAVGAGAFSTVSSAITPAGVPAAPTSIGATPGNGQVTVSWTAPSTNGGSAITSYDVRYSTNGGGSWTSAGVAYSGSPAVVTGLTNGTSYLFEVAAINGIGASGYSTPSTAVTPSTIPGVPTAVSATASDAQATVSWTAPANGGAAITGYDVRYSSDNGTTWTSAGSFGSSPATVTGLANGTSYVFDVAATNIVGASGYSTPSSAVVPAGVAGAPSAVSAVAGNAHATVTWTAPAANGSPITGYDVRFSSNGGTSWTSAGTFASNPADVTGLVNGTSYVFDVAAIDASGTGTYSAWSTPVTPSTTPGAPAVVSLAAGDGQVSLTWSAPSSGGSPITGYDVEWSSDDGTTWSSPLSAPTTSATVTGLTNGTTYKFRIAAVNANGSGSFSDPSDAVTPAAVPGMPTSVVATAGDASATVAWVAPSTGGSSISSYDVRYSSDDGATWTSADIAYDASPATVTGLVNGTSYAFEVAAINGVGAGAYSSPSTAIVPAGAPAAPTAPTVTGGEGQATVSWTAPSSNGADITSYVVRYSADSGSSWTSAGSYTSSPAVVTGLVNGTPYLFDVAATNTVGTGAFSAASSAVTPVTSVTSVTKPDAPTAVGGIRDGNSAVLVTWTAPADGGDPITGYDVEWSTDGSDWSAPLDSALTSTSTSALVTGLTDGTAYVFRVAAINGVGTGQFATPSTPVTPASAPGVPTNVSAVAGDGQATVSWIAPASGPAITSYDVRYSADGGTTWTSAGTAFAGSPATVSGLTNGTAYLFEIAALNDVGAGDYSSPSAAVTPWRDASSLTRGATTTIKYGASLVVSTVLKDATTGSPMGGYAVQLMSRTSTAKPWALVKTVSTSWTGSASVPVKPGVLTMYMWQFGGVPGHAATSTTAQTVSVAQIVTVAQTASTIVHGAVVKFYGIVSPNETNQYVYLQILIGRTWKTTAVKAKIVRQRLPNGTTTVGYVLAVKTGSKGTFSYRVNRPATLANAAGTSKTLTLRVI